MTKAELRQWVETNPGRVNEWDEDGITPLYAAVYHLNSLPLVLWLLDEKGADVNKRIYNGQISLHAVHSLDILNALLDRGADPTLLRDEGFSPLMQHANYGRIDMVARLLKDPRSEPLSMCKIVTATPHSTLPATNGTKQ